MKKLFYLITISILTACTSGTEYKEPTYTYTFYQTVIFTHSGALITNDYTTEHQFDIYNLTTFQASQIEQNMNYSQTFKTGSKQTVKTRAVRY